MLHTALSEGLGYEGKVTLTLKGDRGHTLSSKTYKNSGTAKLFEFLGHCLIDDYDEAKRLLPHKILLLYNKAESRADAKAKEVTAMSSFQSIVQTPTIFSDSNTEQVKVVYSFEVPRASIAGPFNQVALYGANVTEVEDFSAYYYLVDTSSNNLELQDVDSWSTTTVLLIEWELTISNKNTEALNS